MKIMTKALLTVGVGLCLCATASAQNISVGNATGSPGGATTPALVPIVFTRNAAAPVADYIARVSYTTANLDATVAGINGGGCTVDDATGVITSVPVAGSADLPSNTYCNITFTIAVGAPAPSSQALTLSFAPGGTCLNASADPVACTVTNGAITVTAPAVNTLSVVSGTPQSATVSTQFANPLRVRVAGAANAPVPNVTVNFTAQTVAGATASLSAASCLTAANGECEVTATANATAGGPYNVVAASTGLTSVNFALTNTAAAVNTLSVVSGTPQSATVSTQFANPLRVRVAGAANAPVPNVTVNFTAQTVAGATASLSAASCLTAANGECEVTATANATAGGPYNVVAASTGLTSVNFALTNTAGTAVPPTLTYIPVPTTSVPPPGGPFLSIPYGAQGNIQVLCASPAADGTACGGSGIGDAATTRLQNISVLYIGASFSPIGENLSCVFANQGNTTVASPLNFVAQTADAGNIRCTCANNPTTSDNYRVSVQEVRPVGGTVVTQRFDITCGGLDIVCGSLTATPSSGTIALNTGAAASQVTALQAAGITPPNTRAVTCEVSGASAGTTFTIAPPSPITVGGTAVNVSASCVNTTTTTGTGTLTCTAAANTPLLGCPALTASYNLTCTGRDVPPQPPELIAVPTLNEQGRILLAALMLLLGLGVVGFRMRG